MEALANKDILCVTHLKDMNKRLYILKEHVNEECWTSASILQGMHSWESEQADHVDNMVADWVDHHDNGWDDILN